MGTQIFKNIFRLIFVAAIISLTQCDEKSASGTGILDGKISIGPLCPVERNPPDPGCQPTTDTYRAYPVSVFTARGYRKIVRLSPALDGSFSIELPAGTYLVAMENQQQGIGGSNLPENVTIHPDTETTLNISIDTGIR